MGLRMGKKTERIIEEKYHEIKINNTKFPWTSKSGSLRLC
jgi:hypothetical protein